MDKALDQLLEHPAIRRAGDPARSAGADHVHTGHAALDAALPGGGWPRGALTEVLHERSGIGELRLLMPALARLSHQGKWIALIAPPHIPYAPALSHYGIDLAHVLLVHPRTTTDALWAVEQALRAGTCGAVLAWPRRIDDRSLRRLQLAAEEGHTMGVLFRATAEAGQPSPAALRLHLEQRPGQPPLAHVLKCRGGGRITDIPLEPAHRRDTAPAAPPETATPSASGPTAPPTRRRENRVPTTVTPPAAATARPRSPRGGRRRAAQLDLPLVEPPRGGVRPQATPANAPRQREGRIARLLDKLR